jgi:deoxycytidylate deaminase
LSSISANAAAVSEPKPDPREGYPLLRPFQDSELVIGLIAPLGASLESVRRILEDRLRTAGYEVFRVRITEHVIPELVKVEEHDAGNFEARTTALMNAGNKARKDTGDNGILALGAARVISAFRSIADGSDESDAEEKPIEVKRRAYIISSIKHPDEVAALRMIYPEAFYLIGVQEDRARRRRYLIEDKRVPENRVEALLDRDENEAAKYGQHVTDAFHLSDFFVRLDGSEDRLRNTLWRIVGLLFGDAFLTPTFDEFAMFMAFAASLRSADLSRQVGAVIAKDDQVLATGANDCPRYGGGLYWPLTDPASGECRDVPEGRDHVRDGGQDSNVVERLKIVSDIVKSAEGLLGSPEKLEALPRALRDGPLKGVPAEDLDLVINGVMGAVKEALGDRSKLEDFEKAVRAGKVRDLTEYGRVVHAEMEALLSCGRASVSAVGATVYTTTFPCHNCAKHVIAAGVRRVVFIEPYQKSKAFLFHSEAIELGFQGEGPPPPKVRFEPFVGVGPRRFFDLFSTRLGSGFLLTRKFDDTGKKKHFSLESARLRLQMIPRSYLDVEAEATEAFNAQKIKGNADVSHDHSAGRSESSSPAKSSGVPGGDEADRPAR